MNMQYQMHSGNPKNNFPKYVAEYQRGIVTLSLLVLSLAISMIVEPLINRDHSLTFAQDLIDIANNFSEPIHVIGHSFGGIVAQYAASKSPQSFVSSSYTILGTFNFISCNCEDIATL